ncbi:MAG: hypothetical protein JXA46_15705 [Dehalococcoidales bacterium]|nr:hypothetical protein [Dehalococcoidales bacterium]
MSVAIPLVIVTGIIAWILRPVEITKDSGTLNILAVVIPPGLLAITALVYQVVFNAAGKTMVSDVSNALFIAGTCLTGAGLLASIGLAFSHRSKAAKRTGFGVCIDIIVYVILFVLLEWLGGL